MLIAKNGFSYRKNMRLCLYIRKAGWKKGAVGASSITTARNLVTMDEKIINMRKEFIRVQFKAVKCVPEKN